MKIRVYFSFLIARLQISKWKKELCCQSNLLPKCCLLLIKSIKVDYKSSLNDWFLVSVDVLCLLLVSFPFLLTLAMFQTSYIFHLKIKTKSIASVSNLKHTA